MVLRAIIFTFLSLIVILSCGSQDNLSLEESIVFILSSNFSSNGYIGSEDIYNPNIYYKYCTGKPISSSPICYHGKVIFGGNDRYIYCLDSSRGDLIWRYKTNGIVQSSPLILNKYVYIGSNDGNVYCIDLTSGNLIWKVYTGGPVGASSPSYGNGKLYIGNDDGCLTAIDITNGRVIWRYNTIGPIWISPLYFNGNVYICSGLVYGNTKYAKGFYEIDCNTGILVNIYNTGVIKVKPVISGNYIIVTDGKSIYKVDPFIKSINEIAPIDDTIMYSICLSNNNLYLPCEDGSLLKYNIKDNHSAKLYFTRMEITSGLCITDNFIYCGDAAGYIYGFDIDGEKLIWDLKVGRIISSLYINNGIIYICSNDGCLYSVKDLE